MIPIRPLVSPRNSRLHGQRLRTTPLFLSFATVYLFLSFCPPSLFLCLFSPPSCSFPLASFRGMAEKTEALDLGSVDEHALQCGCLAFIIYRCLCPVSVGGWNIVLSFSLYPSTSLSLLFGPLVFSIFIAPVRLVYVLFS